MRKVIMAVSAIFLLAVGSALAGGWWPPPPPPGPVVIGVTQPESDASAVGWDNTPAAGNWGGRGADGTFAVAWENDSPDIPDLFGRFAEVTIPGKRGVVPTRIEIGYLAGLANDDFCVLVSLAKWHATSMCPRPPSPTVFVAVGCINEDESNTNEVWTVTGPTELVLPPNLFQSGQDVTVQIRVTGNAWWGFKTWGQLAIDYIKVWGVAAGGGGHHYD